MEMDNYDEEGAGGGSTKTSSFQCPRALQVVLVELPSAVTAPHWGTATVEYTDCAENCVLRFLQVALLADPGTASWEWTPRGRISAARAGELGAIPELVDFFERHPVALSQHAYASTAAGMAERCEFACLVTRRDGCAYVREGGFEMNAGVGNFLAVVRALFPCIELPAEAAVRADNGASYEQALQIVCDFFSTPRKHLQFHNFSFEGPTTVTRGKPPSWHWVHPIYGGVTPNGVAVDRKTRADLAVNGVRSLRFEWWDRDFPAEQGLVAVTSGHAQLYDIDDIDG